MHALRAHCCWHCPWPHLCCGSTRNQLRCQPRSPVCVLQPCLRWGSAINRLRWPLDAAAGINLLVTHPPGVSSDCSPAPTCGQTTGTCTAPELGAEPCPLRHPESKVAVAGSCRPHPHVEGVASGAPPPCHCSSDHTAGPVGCLCTAQGSPLKAQCLPQPFSTPAGLCPGGLGSAARLPRCLACLPLPGFHGPALHSPLRLPVFQWASQSVKGLPRVREPFPFEMKASSCPDSFYFYFFILFSYMVIVLTALVI